MIFEVPIMADSQNTQENEVVTTGSIFAPLWTEAESEPIVEYRSFSISALLTLIFGVLSLTLLFHWGFFFIPILAILFGGVALLRFRFYGNMLFGKSMIFLGLFFTLFFSTFYFTYWFTYERILIRQAKAFAPLVFDTLKDDDIPGYFDIQRARFHRSKVNVDIRERWKSLGKDEMEVETIESVLNDPLIRTLIALGDQADIAFVKVANLYHVATPEIGLMYSVTYPGKNGKETFFMNVWLARNQQEEKVQGKTVPQASWRLLRLQAPVLPKELGGNDFKKI